MMREPTYGDPTVDAWWWSDGNRLSYSDEVPAVGITHRLPEGLIPILCERGYHASRRLIDALRNAPGSTLWRVRLSGVIVEDTDQLVASERTYIEKLDCEDLLHEFARWCALQVIHLWDAPEVVREYLATGRKDLQAAARVTARAAASAATRASARDPEWIAARDPEWIAARAAAAAAGAAAASARDPEWIAARDAAAAAGAAGAAAAAAGAATRAAQNERLVEMVAAIRAEGEEVAP